MCLVPNWIPLGKRTDRMTKKAKMPIHPESLDTSAIMAGRAGMIGGPSIKYVHVEGKKTWIFADKGRGLEHHHGLQTYFLEGSLARASERAGRERETD